MRNIFANREKKTNPIFDVIAVVLAIALFTAFTLPQALTSSAYFDEGYSAYLAQFDILTISGYTAQDVHPPLYYIALHFWQAVAGDGVGQLRFLSIVFAWITLVFGFLIVRRWFGQRAAWLTIILMALSPLFIRYGATMRMYTMALAIAFSATYVLLRAVGSKNKKWWTVYAVLVAAGMWTNYFMALVWATHLLWMLYEYRRKSDVIKPWRKSLVIAFVLYLPWLPMLLFRYGEVQVNGFWIKPLSVDTLVSTITQSLVFRSATNTTAWLVIGIIALIIMLAVAGRVAYKKLDTSAKPAFRLLLAMSSLPAILLALGSLPPLRSSYVYRYIIVAAVASTLVMAIIITHAAFKKRQHLKQGILLGLAFVVLASGASHAIAVGNRNLDTGDQNRLKQVIESVHRSNHPAMVVLRSPYSYYVGRFYTEIDYPVSFLYTDKLAKMGSTVPLAEHSQYGVTNLNELSKVWLVGEDVGSVSAPQGNWIKRDYLVEYDDVTKKAAAVAVYYEKVQ